MHRKHLLRLLGMLIAFSVATYVLDLAFGPLWGSLAILALVVGVILILILRRSSDRRRSADPLPRDFPSPWLPPVSGEPRSMSLRLVLIALAALAALPLVLSIVLLIPGAEGAGQQAAVEPTPTPSPQGMPRSATDSPLDTFMLPVIIAIAGGTVLLVLIAILNRRPRTAPPVPPAVSEPEREAAPPATAGIDWGALLSRGEDEGEEEGDEPDISWWVDRLRDKDNDRRKH